MDLRPRRAPPRARTPEARGPREAPARAAGACGREAPAARGPLILSPREGDALRLLAMGYSRAEAAATLAISEHTIRDYIDGARTKLGAQNVIHAVARAVSTGAIRI